MSASSTPTSRPSVTSAAARFTVSVDLPTPPLPEATAMIRVVAGSWTPRVSVPPRSLVVSAARSSGVITSNRSSTEATPGSEATCVETCSSKLERSGQPTTVSAIVTVTAPPSISTPRTMSSSVTGRRSSGSITRPSASSTCSRDGIVSSVAEQHRLQIDCVAHGEPLPVVVEVREDVDLVRPAREPLAPLLQFGLRVVAVAAAAAGVEAHEGEVGRQLVSLKRVHLRTVGDDECAAVLAKQRIRVVAKPRRVPKLERVPVPVVQPIQRHCEPVEVATEGGRQLPEERAELGRAQQRLDPLVEERQVLRDVVQPLHLRQIAAHLDRENEVVRRLLHPARDGRRARQTVEGRVDLDRVEVTRVEREPVPRREARWVEHAVPPVGVVPAGAADPQPASASARRRHSCSVPAAATRERPARSSGAAPNGGASGSSIARPRSRTSSCAAAMSTERAGFSDTTPSTRPAARWQSETASEPITRSRCASPANRAALSATKAVVVA